MTSSGAVVCVCVCQSGGCYVVADGEVEEERKTKEPKRGKGTQECHRQR